MAKCTVVFKAGLVICGVILALILMVSEAQFGTVDKHNLGYVLTKRRQIQVSTARARLVFHFELPRLIFPVDFEPVNCTELGSRRGDGEGMCKNLFSMISAYRDMKIKMSEYLKDQLDNIYQVLIDLPARNRIQKRGRSLWTDFWSSVTGLAEQSDVDQMSELMQRIEHGIQEATEV